MAKNSAAHKLLQSATKAENLAVNTHRLERAEQRAARLKARQERLKSLPDLDPSEIAERLLESFTDGLQNPIANSELLSFDPIWKESELSEINDTLIERAKVCAALQDAISELRALNQRVRIELEKVAEVNPRLAQNAAVVLTTTDWSIKHALKQ